MFEKKFKSIKPFLLILFILLSGIGYVSFSTLSRESIPDVNLPFFNITAVYPGSDPETIEQQVITKIEDKLPSVDNISTFSSVSTNNVGVITVEFKRGTDKGTAYTDLKTSIDEVKSILPQGVQDVALTKIDLKDMPIYTFAVTSDLYPSLIYDKVRSFEDEIKKIPGVDKVITVGKYVPQVEIQFDYEKIKNYNLRLPALVHIINSSINQTPIGKKRLDGNLYTFELGSYEKGKGDLLGDLETFKKFAEDIPLINQNGNILKLSDLATVKVTHPFYQRLSFVNGKNAITFMVYKVPGSDITQVINSTKEYLNGKSDFFQKEKLSYKELFSQEIMINDTYNTFVEGFVDTSILILLVITVFLGFKLSLGVLITFPFVYLLTFILLKQLDYTFNTVVSVSLNLSLGIMVDNLIVVAQGFKSGISKGLDKYEAIKYAIGIYKKPLIVGNLVTISILFPIGFVLSGKMGEFLKFLPITVNLTLVFSIVVALIFLPVIISYMTFKVAAQKPKVNKLEIFFHKFEKPFEKVYSLILRIPKIFIILFYSMFILVIFSFVKFGHSDFMPMIDKDNIYINLKYNKDITIEQNKELTSRIYKDIEDFFSKNHVGVVKNIELSLGELYSQSALENTVYRTSFNPELTKINIVLTSAKERSAADNAVFMYPELNAFLNEKISADPEIQEKLVDMSISIQKNGPSGGKDVTFNISSKYATGSEIKVLASEYDKMIKELKQIPGTNGWSSSLEYTNGKVRLTYDLEKISQLNLSIGELNMFLASLNQINTSSNYLTDYKGNGLQISSLSNFGKDIIPVKGFVDYTQNSGNTIDFKDLIIPGTNVYLSDVIKEVKLDSEIKSFEHLEGKLVIRIEANKDPSLPLGNITDQINQIVVNYPNVEMTYAADVKDMQQSGKDMGMAFLVGVVLMFAVLVYNFGNFAQPVIMFLTMPLFLTGALLFLLLSGESMSMLVGIGLFGLIGVGLAHIIYLLDRFNELLHHNEGFKNINQIIIESVKSRLEPVFLTTAITSIALFILAYNEEMWTSFALAFAGGLVVGTFITLIFIPCALKVYYKKHSFEGGGS